MHFFFLFGVNNSSRHLQVESRLLSSLLQLVAMLGLLEHSSLLR